MIAQNLNLTFVSELLFSAQKIGQVQAQCSDLNISRITYSFECFEHYFDVAFKELLISSGIRKVYLYHDRRQDVPLEMEIS